MYTITISYTLIYEVDFAPEYAFDTRRQCWNTKTGRPIKKVYNNGCLGYNLRGRFYSLTYLRSHLRRIAKDPTPF